MAWAPTAMQGSSIRFAGVQRLRQWRWPIGFGQDTVAAVVSSGAGSGGADAAPPAGRGAGEQADHKDADRPRPPSASQHRCRQAHRRAPHIGGVAPSSPTTTASAVRLPSASSRATRKARWPGLSTDRSLAVSIFTTARSSGT
jgi:hypothetical protein